MNANNSCKYDTGKNIGGNAAAGGRVPNVHDMVLALEQQVLWATARAGTPGKRPVSCERLSCQVRHPRSKMNPRIPGTGPIW
jgi:hypothetical protein